MLAQNKRPDCPELPSSEELMVVSGEFIGLSNSMYVYKGGNAGRLMDDNVMREERIIDILKLS